jgi:hypothetical protein
MFSSPGQSEVKCMRNVNKHSREEEENITVLSRPSKFIDEENA